jgi:cathepsin H
MKVLLVIALLAAFACAGPLTATQYKSHYYDIVSGDVALTEDLAEQMYGDFLVTFDKTDSGSFDRYEVFRSNLESMIAHNKDKSNTWRRGINKFSDMTEEEFFEHYNIQAMADQTCSATASPKITYEGDIPDEVDWRKRPMPHNVPVVTEVKDQGHCGSCWTFSTTGAMESHYALMTGKYALLSEQQLVDCAQDFDNHGCSGGLPSHAFEYIRYNGIAFESRYPYHAKDEECHYEEQYNKFATVKESFNLTKGDEQQLTETIANNGPVSVAFQVVNGFKDYESGVYTSDVCKNGETDVNHAVLAVGYGTEDGLDHYIIKNSWSASWGDEGFFKIQRGVNMCGIAVCNSYPVGVSDIYSSTTERFLKF